VKLRWTRSALNDLLEIHAYLDERNPQAALREIRLVRAQTQSLAAHPYIGRKGRIDGTRELVIAGTAFIVAYRVAKDFVALVAVRHAARDWPQELD